MIAIDKDIPLPQARSRNAKYPLANMQVGDSFLLPEGKSNARVAVYGRAKKLGVKVTVRQTTDGLRVWRTQ